MKITHIWFIGLITYSFMLANVKKVDPYITLQNSYKTSISGFSTGFRSSTHTQVPDRNFFEKSRMWIQKAQQQELIERACINATVTEITEFFERHRLQGTFSDQELLTWYCLYRIPYYRMYVKTLPAYEHHISTLYRNLSKDKKTRKKIAKQMDYSVIEAQRWITQLYQELQHDRIVRATYEYTQKEAQETLRIEQERLQVIKTVQQKVQNNQVEMLEQCIANWKTQIQQDTNTLSAHCSRRIQVARGNRWYKQTYPINEQVAQLLKDHNLSSDTYTTVYGNELQHVLHSEFLSIFDHVVLQRTQDISHKLIKKLLQSSIQCAAIGCAYNHEGAVAYASMVADVGWAMLDLASAIGEAIRDATINTAELAIHPLQTLSAISRTIFYFVAATGEGLLYQDTDYQYVPQNMSSTKQLYDNLGHELLTTAYQMTARDWVKSVTCFAAECLLQAKLLALLGSACKNAGRLALKCAQAIELSLPEAKVAIAGAEGMATKIKVGETIGHAAAQEEKLFNLVKQVDGTYRSLGGLIYGDDPKFGNRIYHVLEHIKEITNKRQHTLFNITQDKLFALIDEAWLQKGSPIPNDLGTYVIDMGRIIGTQGETAIRIVTKQGTSLLLTAYPVKI